MNHIYFGGWKSSFLNQTFWISCFEITNFQALDTLTIYSNISKILTPINNWLLIQITLCRNARTQMDISKKNHFSAEKAINYFPSHWGKKKGTNMWNAWVLRVSLFPMLPIFSCELKITAYRGSFTIPLSSKLELLCQCEMTSWYYIVTKSSIVDDLWVRDLPLVCFFFLWERLKINQADICIFKVKKKNTTTRCEICPNLKVR